MKRGRRRPAIGSSGLVQDVRTHVEVVVSGNAEICEMHLDSDIFGTTE